MVHKNKEKYQIHIRLSPWMNNGVEVLSAKLGMTVSDIIRIGINEIIKKELDKKEISMLQNETTAKQLEKIYCEEEKTNPPSKEEDIDFLKKEVNDEESNQDKKTKIEEFVKHFLIDQHLDEWIEEAKKIKRNEVIILEEKLEELKKQGDNLEVEKIEQEIEKIKELLNTFKEKTHISINDHKTGKLKIGNNPDMIESLKNTNKKSKKHKVQKQI